MNIIYKSFINPCVDHFLDWYNTTQICLENYLTTSARVFIINWRNSIAIKITN